MSGDVYGGWQPTTLLDLLECEQDPYITPAGVTPVWVVELRAAARECRAGYPAETSANGRCGMFGCRGHRAPSPGGREG
jgi:hypothetical protein